MKKYENTVSQAPIEKVGLSNKAKFLFLAPLLSVLSYTHYLHRFINIHEYNIALIVILLAWSPLYFSVPAILMQDVRDETLPEMVGVLGNFTRGFLLLPAILIRRDNYAIEMLASLLGFLIALLLAF